ncbi:transposase [Streptomyces lacrimifluminis]
MQSQIGLNGLSRSRAQRRSPRRRPAPRRRWTPVRRSRRGRTRRGSPFPQSSPRCTWRPTARPVRCTGWAPRSAAGSRSSGRTSRRPGSDWQRHYAILAGIEATLSRTFRSNGLRRARYCGLAKAHVQHILTAMACNLTRTADWIAETPRGRARSSRFHTLCTAATG